MKTSFSILIVLLSLVAIAQPNETSFEKIDSLKPSNDKDIVVFIHTDWCKFCKKMQATTFQNEEVINLLNESFLFNSLDAESKDPILFNGRTFRFIPKGINVGEHELAKALGATSYPYICILNSKYEIIFQYEGYLSSNDLLTVLKSSIE